MNSYTPSLHKLQGACDVPVLEGSGQAIFGEQGRTSCWPDAKCKFVQVPWLPSLLW